MRLRELLLGKESSEKIAFLDVVRGLAVLFVFARHSWGLAGSPALEVGPVRLGNFIFMMSTGVDLFFVLSGVLLAPRFLASSASVGRAKLVPYFKSRMARIGPPYWLAMGLVVLLYTPVLIPYGNVWSWTGLSIFLAHALILQGAFVFSFGAYPVATPFWTLTVEVLFYALLPLVARFFAVKRWYAALPASLVISLGWLVATRYSLDGLVHFADLGMNFSGEVLRFFLSHQILGYAFHFGVGIAIASILTKVDAGSPSVSRWGYVCLCAGAALLLAAMYWLGGLGMDRGYGDPLAYMRSEDWAARFYYLSDRIPFAAAYGLIILGIALAGKRASAFVGRIAFLRYLGICGYSIYLLHMPLLWTVHQYSWVVAGPTPEAVFAKMFFFGGAVVLAVSFLFYLGVERPSVELSHRFRASGRRVGSAENR